MTVHLTSSVRMGEDRARTGADSFGRVWGVRNLRVNDASLLPDAPGVNPQAAIMTIAARNTDHFLARRDVDERIERRRASAAAIDCGRHRRGRLARAEPRARPRPGS